MKGSGAGSAGDQAYLNSRCWNQLRKPRKWEEMSFEFFNDINKHKNDRVLLFLLLLCFTHWKRHFLVNRPTDISALLMWFSQFKASEVKLRFVFYSNKDISGEVD